MIKVEPTERARFQSLKPDTSYYFTCYHKFGNQEITGFLEIDRHWLFVGHLYSVPDREKDPDGSKGIMRDYYNIIETGLIDYLWEYELGGIVSAGGWDGDGKNGKWFSGFLLKSKLGRKSYFVKTKKQLFKEDELVSNSLIEFNSIKWPDIKGNWVANQEFSNDSVFLFHRIPKSSGEYSIEFTSDKRYYLNSPPESPKGFHEWWTNGDRLFLKIGNETHEYKIISFTGPELVIQDITKAISTKREAP